MAYNGAGSVFALGMRMTRLGADGSPLVGPANSYMTDALVQVQLGLEYEDGQTINQLNGSGVACLQYKAPDNLTRGTISGLQVCQPDPNVLGFLTGGEIIRDAEGAEVGFAAPEVGTDPLPNGVGLEFWSWAIKNGTKVGYFWWVIPRARLKPSGSWTLSGSDPLLPELEGFCEQNPNWEDGPDNLWPYISDRVWQYAQVPLTDPPDFTPGPRAVLANPTVTSISVTPATASLDVGETAQLTAIATRSDSSTRDVTDDATWTSSAPATATVSTDGLVTGIAVGNATVTATLNAQTDTTAVTVA